MIPRKRLSIATTIIAVSFSGFLSAFVQALPAMPSQAPTNLGEKSGFDGAMTQGDLQKLGDYMDRQHMLDGKDPEKVHKEVMERVRKEVKTINLACEVNDAVQAGRVKSKITGKSVDLFETSCTNGAGYILIAQGKNNTSVISCFSADVTHQADVDAGLQSDLYCQLPENANINTMATNLLKAAGANCDANKVKWFGQSAAKQLEYTEAACADGNGYLLLTALAGSSAKPSALNCVDAAKQGLTCKLTNTSVVGIETLTNALIKNGVTCKIENLRVIGQEKLRKRYVVEGLCPAPDLGFVAFIPLDDNNTNKFEKLTCDAAKAIGVVCKLTSAK